MKIKLVEDVFVLSKYSCTFLSHYLKKLFT